MKLPVKYFLIMLAVYLAGLLIGIVLIWYQPIYYGRSNLLDATFVYADSYFSDGYVDYPKLLGMEYYLFDSSGNAVLEMPQFRSDSDTLFDDHTLIQRIFKEASVFETVNFKTGGEELIDEKKMRENFSIGVCAATVYTGPDGAQYASVILKDLPDLDAVLQVFASCYSVMIVILCIFMIFYMNRMNELNKMRRNLVANVSHGLKTPITSIKAMAEVIYHDEINRNSRIASYSAGILEQTDCLEALIGDMLILSKLQSHEIKYHLAAISVVDLFSPEIDRYMMLCYDLKLKLLTDGLFLDALPPLYTDAEKIITVFNVLMDNAIKYIGKGDTIKIYSLQGENAVTICVEDNGPGIPLNAQKHIFDRFYRVDEAHETQGSGLGLAIAKEITDALGEKLYVKSFPNHGSTFYFTIRTAAHQS